MTKAQDRAPRDDVIGLIPAAGQATRLGPLPCSKELYPVGLQADGSGRPKVACQYLLERMRSAAIIKAYIVLRAGKWDIPAYFGDGASMGMHLAYLLMGVPYGAPFTLDQAFAFVARARIALGFPDILFEPVDAYTRLLARQERSGADVVLGLFKTTRPQKCDLVEVDDRHHVHRIFIKPDKTALRYTWMNAVWAPAFTSFMHKHLAAILPRQADAPRELFLGDVLQAAIDAGMRVEAECFDAGRAIDIGTLEDLQAAVRLYGHRLPDVG